MQAQTGSCSTCGTRWSIREEREDTASPPPDLLYLTAQEEAAAIRSKLRLCVDEPEARTVPHSHIVDCTRL
jgi:hypothetical protein